MITINAFLDSVLDDFREYVKTKRKLCNLLDAHFDGGKIPDYSQEHIQQLYLLRYAYAYAFEYKHIYMELINKYDLRHKIKVTSVGCGNLLDYWSLVYAVKENCDICYRGADAIDWSYKMKPRSRDDVKVVIDDVVTLFQNEQEFSSDIYIFPKSISELSYDKVRRLAECFTKANISKEVVHFVFSLRNDQGSRERDMDKTKIIYDRLIECGFRTKDKRLGGFSSVKDKRIREVDDDFQHPNEVVDYLKVLYAKCSDFDDCPDGSACQERLGRWPILNCKYAEYQIFTFER